MRKRADGSRGSEGVFLPAILNRCAGFPWRKPIPQTLSGESQPARPKQIPQTASGKSVLETKVQTGKRTRSPGSPRSESWRSSSSRIITAMNAAKPSKSTFRTVPRRTR